jgi:hypothetical protein
LPGRQAMRKAGVGPRGIHRLVKAREHRRPSRGHKPSLPPAPLGKPMMVSSGRSARSRSTIRAVGAITQRSNSAGARLPDHCRTIARRRHRHRPGRQGSDRGLLSAPMMPEAARIGVASWRASACSRLPSPATM